MLGAFVASLPIALKGDLTALPVAFCSVGAVVAGWTDGLTGYVFDDVVGLVLCAELGAALAVGRAAESAFGAEGTMLVLLCLHLSTRGRGLGLGDVKLGACLGAGLGPVAGLASIGIAFMSAGSYGVFLLVTGRARRDSAIRFAPFLGIGALALGYRACYQ